MVRRDSPSQGESDNGFDGVVSGILQIVDAFELATTAASQPDHRVKDPGSYNALERARALRVVERFEPECLEAWERVHGSR